jgi:hypothetical protein
MRAAFALALLLAAGKPPREIVTAAKILDWLTLDPPHLGCTLQKGFGAKDPKWNCALKTWAPSGDFCKNPREFAAGLQIADATATKIHPLLKSVKLAWENGAIQSMVFEFSEKVSETQARRMLKLPAPGTPLPPGILQIGTGECTREGSCLTLKAFERTSAEGTCTPN